MKYKNLKITVALKIRREVEVNSTSEIYRKSLPLFKKNKSMILV